MCLTTTTTTATSVLRIERVVVEEEVKQTNIYVYMYKEYGQMIEINYLLESNDTKFYWVRSSNVFFSSSSSSSSLALFFEYYTIIS